MLYEFTELQLSKDEFDNLIFMNAPPHWTHEYHRNRDSHERDLTKGQVFLLELCSKPLKKVVQSVIEESGLIGQDRTVTAVFEQLSMKAKHKKGGEEPEPWFKSYADLSRCFKKELMPPIWIRNLSYSPDGKDYREREKCPDGTYYIEDGSHRALIYAVCLELTEDMEYEPFPAIHATSWGVAAEILEHLPQNTKVLENAGVLPYKRHFKEGVRLPIGIRTDLYQRD